MNSSLSCWCVKQVLVIFVPVLELFFSELDSFLRITKTSVFSFGILIRDERVDLFTCGFVPEGSLHGGFDEIDICSIHNVLFVLIGHVSQPTEG